MYFCIGQYSFHPVVCDGADHARRLMDGSSEFVTRTNKVGASLFWGIGDTARTADTFLHPIEYRLATAGEVIGFLAKHSGEIRGGACVVDFGTFIEFGGKPFFLCAGWGRSLTWECQFVSRSQLYGKAIFQLGISQESEASSRKLATKVAGP